MRQELGLALLDPLSLLENLGHLTMHQALATPKQRIVGRVPDQRVTEGVARRRRHAVLAEQLGATEAPKLALQRRVVVFAYLADEPILEFPTDGRAYLSSRLRTVEAVESCHERVLQGRWDVRIRAVAAGPAYGRGRPQSRRVPLRP